MYSSLEAHLAAVARQLGCESRQPGNKKCFNNKLHLYFEAVGPHCLKKICEAGELFFMDGTRFMFPGKGFEITVLILCVMCQCRHIWDPLLYELEPFASFKNPR